MTISKRGLFPDQGHSPIAKSPWNFERYDSDMERKMMVRLERDPHVLKWIKRHGLVIPWIDGQKHQRRYAPDFLIEYEGGRKAIVEVKDPSRIDSNDVQRKRKAAEIWCRQRGMTYEIATIG